MIQQSFNSNPIDLLNARSYLQKLLPETFDGDDGTLTYYMLEGYLFAVCCAPTLVAPSIWSETIWNGTCPIKDMKKMEEYLKHIMNLYNAISQAIQNEQAFTAKTAPFLQPLEKNLAENSPMAQWTHGFILGDMPNMNVWESIGDHPECAEDLDTVEYAGANLALFLNRATAEDAFNGAAGEFTDLNECLTYFKKNFDLSMHNYSAAAQNIYQDLTETSS